MLFNTYIFGGFFVIVYGLYLVLNHKWQNRMLLVASYIFYGSWDWRFLSLIFISTVLDYIYGIKIHESSSTKRRKLFLFLSVFGNLSILGFFKYFGFFASSLTNLLNLFGLSIQPHFLQIILPVGISFYTFKTMSYTIDIYRNRIKPTRRFFDYALFIAYFPQLLAGPIERAERLLPQVLSPRKLSLDKFYEGCHLMFWGLFQKVFIADNLAKVVTPIFGAGPPYNGVEVLLASYAFAFQIFCDFSGYSDIARGLGKCMGFDTMINFNLPYFATNPGEFWQRWHISLSTWLRDYLYIPLGGNRKGSLLTYRNLGITMLLGGLWHGASWTFIIWGAYHGTLLMIHRLIQPLIGRIRFLENVFIKKIWFVVRVAFFFHLVSLGWVIFRAQSITQAYNMLKSVVFNFELAPGVGLEYIALQIAFFVGFLVIIQIVQYWKNDLMIIPKTSPIIRALFYFVYFYLFIIYGAASGQEFIYFQF